MMRVVTAAALLAACSGRDKDTDEGGNGQTTSYAFDCDVSEDYADLPDPFAPIRGQEHACETQPAYVPVSGATSFYVGEFHFDDCGNLRGTETWTLYANPTWVQNGGADCVVVWNLEGAAGDPVNKGDYSVEFDALVDLAATTCDDVDGGYMDGEEIYAGSEEFHMAYDVSVMGTDATVFWASGGSLDGDKLGDGAANANHVTYTTDFTCPFF